MGCSRGSGPPCEGRPLPPTPRLPPLRFVKSRLADGLWMSTAGGEISKTTSGQPVDTQLIDIPFDRCQIKSGGYGILDVLFLKVQPPSQPRPPPPRPPLLRP